MKRITRTRLMRTALLTTALMVVLPAAIAHTGTQPGKAKSVAPLSVEEEVFGRPGDLHKVDRTIAIDMSDMMRFGPAHINIKQGETIRFMVTNQGKILHEMVLGTIEELKAHRAMMKKHPGMEHDAPYGTHVAPGKKEALVWQFTRTGEFYYACLIPGHFEAGMMGKIIVTKG